MAGGREIKTKIKSVQNTRKVTRALEMVSASKIRKAQDLMKASRPYTRLMRQVIGHIAKANTEYKHPFLRRAPGDVKRVAAIVISTDRGLCGGLNSNLFRRLLVEIRKRQELGQEVDVVAIGQKAVSFFKRVKVNLVASVSHLGERPQIEELMGVAKVVFDSYKSGHTDQVFLVLQPLRQHDEPAGAGRPAAAAAAVGRGQRARARLGLPVRARSAHGARSTCSRATPSRCCTRRRWRTSRREHAARMVAMKSASDNATKLIGNLQLIYNKARQAAITQEISEIVGGAAAV